MQDPITIHSKHPAAPLHPERRAPIVHLLCRRTLVQAAVSRLYNVLTARPRHRVSADGEGTLTFCLFPITCLVGVPARSESSEGKLSKVRVSTELQAANSILFTSNS